MSKEKLSMAELKNRSIGFDRAEMRDLHVIKDDEDYLCKRAMGVWNVNKKQLACLAPKSYTVIQHKHAVESIIEAITSLNIKATTELQASKHGIYVDFNFPEAKFELKDVGDEYTTGIRVVSRYDQTAGLVISPRVTRLACSNGMIVTDVVKSQRIKFTEQLKITAEGLIDKMIKDIISNDEKLANMVSICMKDSIEWNTAKLLLIMMFKKKTHAKQIYNKLDPKKERISRWDFYNAVTDYATHGERLKPNVEAWLQNKANEIIKTSFNELSEINKPKKKAAAQGN